MSTITVGGNEFNTIGNLPKVGSKAPDFTLITVDLSKKSLSDFKGSKLILNISPSIDTSTCATSVRVFNKKATELNNTHIAYISRDLPFAQKRFCGAEGIENVIALSDYISGEFGKKYNLNFTDGPLEGLNSRCIIVIDENGIVIHTEQVAETADEPNYEAALDVLK